MAEPSRDQPSQLGVGGPRPTGRAGCARRRLASAAQKPSAEQLRPAVEIGLGALPPVIAREVFKAVDQDFEPQHEGNRETHWSHGDRCQLITAKMRDPSGETPEGSYARSTGRTISIQIDAAQMIIAAPYNPKRTHAPFSLRPVTM